MPSIYTHDTFGRLVYNQLPSEVQRNLAGHKRQFRMGLQGPDYLFFYHPLLPLRPNRLGHKLHKQSAREFIEPLLPLLREAGYDSAEYAYIVGFICHFMLDSTCHQYVNEKAKERGFNHLVMEMELDRHYLQKSGKDPVHFPLYTFVARDSETIRTLAKIYERLGISEKQVATSLTGMYLTKKLFTAGKGIKRFFIRMIMIISLHYWLLEGHMMDLLPKKSASITNGELTKRLDASLQETVPIIQEFHRNLYQKKPLNPRFDCTFLSNENPQRKETL